MSNKDRKSRRLLVRGPLLLCGALVVLWTMFALPSFRLTVPARDITARIIADERFKRGILPGTLARMETVKRPSMLQAEFSKAEALLMLRAAEETVQRQVWEESDRGIEAAGEKIRTALSINPGDSFLWLMLYSVETARNGFGSENIKLLDRSYAVGPLEGWIAIRRNRLALAIFPMLRDNVQRAAVSEFAELVDSDFIEEAASNLTGVGWSIRERLLSELVEVDITSRQALAKLLSSNGIKLAIPGIKTDERPWR